MSVAVKLCEPLCVVGPAYPMPDNALSSASPAVQTADPTQTGAQLPADANGSGARGDDPAALLAEKIQRASLGAVDQHLSETKRKPGQRGPDKAPRRPRVVPLESVDAGPGETPLEEGAAVPLGGWVDSQPAFDEETAKQIIEIALGLLNDGAGAVIRAIAKKETGDEKLADEAAASVRMSEKIEGTIKTGAVACARKYAVNMAYAPEIMLGGGLVIWAGQVTMTGRALKAKGAELRERAKAQAQPKAA